MRIADFQLELAGMIRAIVFDLDGVLVDAVEWHFQAFNRALSIFGYSITKDEHQALYNGLPTRTKLEILSQRTGLPRALHPFLNELKQHYTREIAERELKPNDEHANLLSTLKREGYRLAVATNCTRATLELFLQKLKISEVFEFALSQEEVSAPKPHPAIYFEALKRFGVSASEMAIVEDSLTGVTAATAVTNNLIVVRSPREVTLERLRRDLKRQPETDANLGASPDIEIVIPMAGEGARFQQKGYAEPKPLIPIFGRPMVDWVIENLRPTHLTHRFTFLCRQSHLRETNLASNLRWLSPECQIVDVPETTQGAACTVLLALEHLDLQKPLLIANVDQWLGLTLDPFFHHAATSGCDGLILTFPASDPKWSYAKTTADNQVVEVAEKLVISPHATTGIYYFKKGAYFVEAAEALIRHERRTRGEFYVCPVYNEMIRLGLRVEIFPIAEHEMHGLGTPEDLEAFVRWNLKAATPSPFPTPAQPR